MIDQRPDGSVVLAACNSIQNCSEAEEAEAKAAFSSVKPMISSVGNALPSKKLNNMKWCGIDKETKTCLLCLEECEVVQTTD